MTAPAPHTNIFTLDIITAWQQLSEKQATLVKKFSKLLDEDFLFQLLRDRHFTVPLNQKMWFYDDTSFLWAAPTVQENGTSVIQVHAAFVSPFLSPSEATFILQEFETRLNQYAQEHKISEIGFYTRRNPQAFMRRLNRAGQNLFSEWTLDSYVLKRAVPEL